MLRTILRLLIKSFSGFFNTDKLSDFFPVSVKGIIIDDGRIILLKNEREEWDFPGGKIQLNNSPIETLKREIKEELNIYVNNEKLVDIKNIYINNLNIIVVFYIVNVDSNHPIDISFEHIEYNFFKKDQIENLNILEEYKEIIKKILWKE